MQLVTKEVIEYMAKGMKAAGLREMIIFGKLDASSMTLNLDHSAQVKYLPKGVTKNVHTESISYCGVTVHVMDFEMSNYSREDLEKDLAQRVWG